VWQLDTGKRRYKPRLGSPLLFFVDSPDSSISCVSILLVSLILSSVVLYENPMPY
jgi:hypothetical protein